MAEPLSRRDLDFLLYEWLDVVALTDRERFAEHSKETFDDVLSLSADMAVQLFAPHNKKADQNEPYVGDDGRVVMIDEVHEALAEFRKSGLTAGSFDEELGGLQLPNVVGRASLAWFQAANPSSSTYPFLTIGNANLLTEYGTTEQIDTWVKPMVEGRFYGTIVSVRAAGRVDAGRHHHQGRTRRRRQLAADRHQDVDLGRRARAQREHRPTWSWRRHPARPPA
ncbi:MAG: acyl-CoA dehydrogenase family protein [Gordonia paraffinivorans]